MNNIFVSATRDVAFLPETRWMGIIGIAVNYKGHHILPIMQRSKWELCGELIKDSWGVLNAKRTFRYRPSIERFDSYEDAIHAMNALLQAIYNPIITPQEGTEVEWFKPVTGYTPEYHRLRKLMKNRLRGYELTNRTLGCLRSADIRTVGDLVLCNADDLMQLRNFGSKCMPEVKTFVAALDLNFGTHTEQFRLNED